MFEYCSRENFAFANFQSLEEISSRLVSTRVMKARGMAPAFRLTLLLCTTPPPKHTGARSLSHRLSPSHSRSTLPDIFLLSPVFTTVLSFANCIISCLFFCFARAARQVSVRICAASLSCLFRHLKTPRQPETRFFIFLSFHLTARYSFQASFTGLI